MPPLVTVMGVAGSGKTTLGAALAAALGCPFREGDDLHPAANVAKMRGGTPLDDADRAPWLDRIAAWLAARRADGGGGVVSCSALKRAYRDRLRQGGGEDLRFVLLDPDRATLRARLAARAGHYMPPALLDSQLATLERLGTDERGLAITAAEPVAASCRRIAAWLAAAGA